MITYVRQTVEQDEESVRGDEKQFRGHVVVSLNVHVCFSPTEQISSTCRQVAGHKIKRRSTFQENERISYQRLEFIYPPRHDTGP